MTPFDSLFDPTENETVRTVTATFAGIERDLHDAIQEHYDALGVDVPDDGPPVEERTEQLRTLIDHRLQGNLWAYFVAEEAPDALKNPSDAETFAGLDDETWKTCLEALAEASDDDGTIRERADTAIQARFGLDLETFESEIVGWTPEETLRRGFRGPIDADIERLRLATRALERSG